MRKIRVCKRKVCVCVFFCKPKPNERQVKENMTSSRNNIQFFNNPLAIRQEIQRFESVHPSIYAIYDLIDLIPDQQIAQQIRDHVVCIEGKRFFLLFFCLSHKVLLFVFPKFYEIKVENF